MTAKTRVTICPTPGCGKPSPGQNLPCAPAHKCRVKGCRYAMKRLKHRLCWAHYRRYLKYGDPGEAARRKREIPAYAG